MDVLERQDPGALHLMPSKEDYIVNYPQITFSDHLTLKLGDTEFFLHHTPGHSDAQICVHVPKERVVFVGDTLFSSCQTWLHSANIGDLLKTLTFLEGLEDVKISVYELDGKVIAGTESAPDEAKKNKIKGEKRDSHNSSI